jgi:hypothetical protein
MLTARQQHCLRGIGIQQWSKRETRHGDGSTTGSVPVVLADDEIEALNQFIETARPPAAAATGVRPDFSENDQTALDAVAQRSDQYPVSEPNEVAPLKPARPANWRKTAPRKFPGSATATRT